jgi:outer membrane protein insertion porin family
LDGTVIPASDSQQHKDCLLVNAGHLRAFSLGRILAALFSVLLLLPCLTVAAQAQQELVAEIDVHGNRRIPTDTIKSRMFTKAGDVYDQNSIERDFNSLWNTGYFQDIRIEREPSPKGWILHVYVKEKPTIRDIQYQGLSSVSQSDVLDRYKQEKVGLTQESQFDPTKVKHAEVVLKALLAEHGRQFATIRTEVRQIPPASVGITFIVKEGPKVKVGKIKFEGNTALSARYLRSSMKNLKPIGIPHSIFLENLFAKTYDASKLEEDSERVRDAMQQKGYFKAVVQEPKTNIRDTKGITWYMPFKVSHGKVVDITLPISEGDQYRLGSIKFTGSKVIKDPSALRKLFPIKDGDVFDISLMRKGLENIRKAFGEIGYINFSAVPDTTIDEQKKLINITVDIDEGAQFYVRRIEFTGNTTTRDKVIRRELVLEEGNVYNSRLWELSLLRLNQLGYFETLKNEQDSTLKTNNQDHTVDITLKVKEKGKNSIGLNGGVSGLAGSFIGLSYQTNNFLGLGETLGVNLSYGQYQRNLSFSFMQPYLFDRPLQAGFTVFNTKYNYNQAQQLSLSLNQQLSLPDSIQQTLQNFSQTSTGFNVSLSYPIKRSFKRIGLTYTLNTTTLEVFSNFSRLYFEELNFSNVAGPNALNGIVTSQVTPSFSFSNINNGMHPSGGHSLTFASQISGLGGTVADVRPLVEYKQYFPMKGIRHNKEGHQVLGYRIQASFLSGYGGKVAPPFERFYMGGDTDLRGFDIRSISPIAFFVQTASLPLVNPDDPCIANSAVACAGVPKDPNNPRRGTWNIPVPVNRLIFPGGDTSIVANLEYRIPIAGPVTLAPFVDTGLDMVLRPSQLQINQQQLSLLNNTPFGCASLDKNFNCVNTGSIASFSPNVNIVNGTNYQPRMSTGLELQVIMPIVNAPFRIYYAYNPLRLNEFISTPSQITRDMFPPGGAGDITYQRAIQSFVPGYALKEPKKTFRFTVATTF